MSDGDKVGELKKNLGEILHLIKKSYKDELKAGLADLLEGVEAIKQELIQSVADSDSDSDSDSADKNKK